MASDGAIEAEAQRRFPWCFPPDSDREDAWRRWEPTRQAAREQARSILEAQRDAAE
jgi:hypothetical protein